MPQTVLQTKGLTKRFGSLVAAKSLSLEVYEGEVFGLLGPNGAGKTTSIRMLCGLLKPDAGEVFEVRWIALERAMAMAMKGEISDGKTVVGLARASALLRSIKSKRRKS